MQSLNNRMKMQSVTILTKQLISHNSYKDRSKQFKIYAGIGT